MKLIIGLGNPGEQYKYTRHNVGFLAIDKICQNLGVKLNKTKFNGEYIKLDDAILAKPITYMNNSGNFVQALANYYDILPEDILIIHDEKDFPLGKSSIKVSGSGGSHNGVIDIVNKLGTEQFKRLKIGIGAPHQGSLRDFVLGRFSKEEFMVLDKVLEEVAKACEDFMYNDIQMIMNKFNQKKNATKN